MSSACRTSNVFEAAAIAGGLVLGVLGASFSPREYLPPWSRDLQFVSPVRWTADGFRAIFVSAEGGLGVGDACLGLVGFTVLFGALGIWRFDPDEIKAKTR